MKRSFRLLAAAPLALLLGACSHQTLQRSMTSSVVSGATGYHPATIIGNKEDTMIINVGNGTDREHGFSIEGYQVERIVQPNETVKVEFRLGRAGVFKIYCQLHPAHQTATLVVR